ncbi:MAG: Nif3-like dinuclear metal center hexameric protein [Lachnospiraceae bacterium]|nr:Nif3-like dinuclear metal center hexameric protein [Lachnospiraceae bacterium]
MKISEVIEKVVAYHPPMDESHPTTDVVKIGDPKQECTGIVVTCFASVNVIRRAAELGANLIIVHEPLFWNHEDRTDWLENSVIFQEKKKLLEENGIVVWRDHDHIHGGSPVNPPLDGIFYGIMKELGWEPYRIGFAGKPLLYLIPETDAAELGLFLKERLNLNGIRIVGDPHTKVSKIFLWEHIREHDPMEEEKLRKVDEEEIDAIIPLELIDWTVSAYVRDASQLGHAKILYNIGHFNFEEIGMKYMLQYLPGLVGNIPVHYVQSGDAFDFLI